MNIFLLLCALISLAAAAPTFNGDAKIVKYENNNDGKGNYSFSFETSNGIYREEIGVLVNAGQPDEHMMVQGSYSYTNPDGESITIHYTADENGYHIMDLPPIVEAPPPGHVVASLLGK